MSEKKGPKVPMAPDAASRIQGHADRTGNNQGFKSRAQSAAAKNTGGQGGKQGGGIRTGKGK